MFCLHVCLYITHVPGAYDGQNGNIGTFGTGVTDVANHHMMLGIKPVSSETLQLCLRILYVINPFFPQRLLGILMKNFNLSLLHTHFLSCTQL